MREDKIILSEGRLEKLLKKKEKGITLREDEIKTGMRLIARATSTRGGTCWICEKEIKKSTPAIFDTGLCKRHTREVLLDQEEN